MERQPVMSSNISSIGYDSGEQVLEVEFKGGATYQYDGVPKPVWDALLLSESKGRFLAQQIKGQFPCMRIE